MTYHNTLTRLKANFMTLKGTVGTSLMNLFKPVLVLVNNAIVVINRFAKAVGDSLGKILGWKYEVGSGAVALDDAAGYAEDLEGGLGGAGKAAKDLKRQLQGFDELNNLTSNDNNGGGGGGGGGAGGSGAGGASDLAGRWVREESLFESEWDTWFKLGRGISEAWTDGLNSIPWDSVYEKAREFGTGFADFLNGLFTPELFGAVGKTIAGSLNTAVYAALAFGETLNWKQMGDAIASGINNYFATFDFVANAKAISTWAKGILDMLIQAVEKTDWAMIGTKIGDFIANLDIPGIVSRMVKLAGKIISALGEAFVSLVKTDPLSAGIVALLLGAKLSGLASKLSPLGLSISSALGTSIGNNSDPITRTFNKLFSVGGAVFAVVKAAIMGWTIGNIIGKIFEKEIERGIENVHTAIKEADKFLTGGLDGKLAQWKMMYETGLESGQIDEKGNPTTSINGDFIERSAKGYKELEKLQTNAYKRMYDNQKKAGQTQYKLQQYHENQKKYSLKGYTSYAQTQMQEMQEQNAKTISKGTAYALSLTKSFGTDFSKEYETFTGGASDYWDNMSTDILGKNQNLVTNIISSVGTTKNSFLTNYEAIRSGTTTKMDTMKNAIGTIMGTMQTDSNTKISTIASTIKSTTNGASTSAQTAFNSMKSNLGTNLSGMNTNTTTSTNSMLNTIRTWSTNVKTAVTNTRANATFGVNYEKVSAVQNAIAKLKSQWTDKKATFSINTSTSVGSTTSIANDILGKIKQAFSWSPLTFLKNAANAIRFFATGGVAESATLGVFGEAGAEAIVPLERNTKWLGRMSNMLADELAYKNYTPTTYSAPKYTGTTSVVAQTSARSEQATAEQNALLREEVELLRQIAGKEFSVSSRDVFNSVQNESENYYNRTGNSPFIF